MNLYLDTSVLVPLFAEDRLAARAETLLKLPDLSLFISDFGSAEFASAIAMKTRMRHMTNPDAQQAFSHFDGWRNILPMTLSVENADISAAESFIRRLDLNLRAPDTIHIAIALRTGATLATFDERMAECARALGVEVANA